jgi:hypothetical protein
MPRKAQTPRTWTEQTVESALSEFLHGRDEWPSYHDFQRSGHKALRDAITRLGGARHWARRLGVTYVQRKPGYAVLWSDDRIRRELPQFLHGRVVWPLRIEFEQAGLKPLRDAIGRRGGPERWAAGFSLSVLNLRSGSKLVWNEERIERELRRFLRGRTDWPPREEFHRAGLSSLLSALYRRGGLAYWASRMGVKHTAAPGEIRKRAWTDERLRNELAEFCRGRTTWPAQSVFRQAGKQRLYSAASLYGGVAYWTQQLGLKAYTRKVAKTEP